MAVGPYSLPCKAKKKETAIKIGSTLPEHLDQKHERHRQIAPYLVEIPKISTSRGMENTAYPALSGWSTSKKLEVNMKSFFFFFFFFFNMKSWEKLLLSLLFVLFHFLKQCSTLRF